MTGAAAFLFVLLLPIYCADPTFMLAGRNRLFSFADVAASICCRRPAAGLPAPSGCCC